jgi:hypothetical protein
MNFCKANLKDLKALLGLFVYSSVSNGTDAALESQKWISPFFSIFWFFLFDLLLYYFWFFLFDLFVKVNDIAIRHFEK